MSSEPSLNTADNASSPTRWLISFWIAWLVATGLAIFNEWPRWMGTVPVDPARAGWWSDPSVDWTPFLPVLLLAVPAWLVRRPLIALSQRGTSRLGPWSGETCPTPSAPKPTAQHVRAVLCSAVVAAAGLAMSMWVASKFGDLPPAYHDEYSYLFQAKTFLAGRLSFPSHQVMPELFDQMHVLNEGRFASRYFPGAGMWIAPFLAMGNAWWGHWAAHAFAAFLVFWIGRQLANNGVGLLAGLLMATSPGVALFSNLLLAHHPTLVGLLVFLVTFLKMRVAIREGGRVWIWALLSGMGLSYAMLCRPMTAAGVGLPFGMWFGWWLLRGSVEGARAMQRVGVTSRVMAAVAMGAPIACGLLGMMAFNRAITGDALLSPYQQYTDIYTPRHVYGFNNRVRGEQHLGPKVIENYDVWAENLTPALAAKNVWRRGMFSFRWTLGIIPLVMTALIVLFTVDLWSSDWRLILASIVSLHAVHVPYWFEGIMGWHYVFETAPLWLLLFAGACGRLSGVFRAANRPWMPAWGASLLSITLLVNLVTIEPLWPSRLDVGVAEIGFSRQKYAAFERAMQGVAGGRRALILVEADPADRHIDYIANSPSLDDPILLGRFRPGLTDINKVALAFPDRDVWLVQIATGNIALVARGRS